MLGKRNHLVGVVHNSVALAHLPEKLPPSAYQLVSLGRGTMGILRQSGRWRQERGIKCSTSQPSSHSAVAQTWSPLGATDSRFAQLAGGHLVDQRVPLPGHYRYFLPKVSRIPAPSSWPKWVTPWSRTRPSQARWEELVSNAISCNCGPRRALRADCQPRSLPPNRASHVAAISCVPAFPSCDVLGPSPAYLPLLHRRLSFHPTSCAFSWMPE